MAKHVAERARNVQRADVWEAPRSQHQMNPDDLRRTQ